MHAITVERRKHTAIPVGASRAAIDYTHSAKADVIVLSILACPCAGAPTLATLTGIGACNVIVVGVLAEASREVAFGASPKDSRGPTRRHT